MALAACGGGGSGACAASSASGSASAASALFGHGHGHGHGHDHATPSLAAQVGQKAFFDQTLSGGKNMACATCHSPQYAYGPPNSLSVQLGSDPTKAGVRATPSLRYKDATPAYADNAANPDGVTLLRGRRRLHVQDGRAATLADQAALPGCSIRSRNERRLEGGCGARSDAGRRTYVAPVQAGLRCRRVRQRGHRLRRSRGAAIQAYESEDNSFHPYTSKYDLYVHNKLGGTLTAAEKRGLEVYNSGDIANCSACHYGGVNFDGNQGLMTDFTYQAIPARRATTKLDSPATPIRSRPTSPTRPISTWACAAPTVMPTTPSRRHSSARRPVLRQVQGADAAQRGDPQRVLPQRRVPLR